MLQRNPATQRLVEFAQKLYDDNLKITNVEVHSAGLNVSVVVLFDKNGQPDRYWVTHDNISDESTWTWVREDNGQQRTS